MNPSDRSIFLPPLNQDSLVNNIRTCSEFTIKGTSALVNGCFSSAFITHFEPTFGKDFDVLFQIIKKIDFTYILTDTYVKVNENVNYDRFVK